MNGKNSSDMSAPLTTAQMLKVLWDDAVTVVERNRLAQRLGYSNRWNLQRAVQKDDNAFFWKKHAEAIEAYYYKHVACYQYKLPQNNGADPNGTPPSEEPELEAELAVETPVMEKTVSKNPMWADPNQTLMDVPKLWTLKDLTEMVTFISQVFDTYGLDVLVQYTMERPEEWEVTAGFAKPNDRFAKLTFQANARLPMKL